MNININIKRHVLIIFSIVLVLLSFTSCSNDELVYSCDKEINELVKKNLTQYSSMTREEWKTLPDSLKIPVYRTFSSQQCSIFWKEKETELMNLEWTDLEKTHILELYSIIDKTPDIFNIDYFDDEAKLAAFNNSINNWLKYSSDVLKWDWAMSYAIVGSGEEYTISYIQSLRKIVGSGGNYYGYDDGGGPGGGGSGGGGGLTKTCKCNQGVNFCWFATNGEYKCKSTTCSKTAHGCGAFWVNSCNGTCELD